MYEVLILLVLVNLGFTSYIWRTVRRGPKRKFLGRLLNGKPIAALLQAFTPFPALTWLGKMARVLVVGGEPL